jgi:hypothetical protein
MHHICRVDAMCHGTIVKQHQSPIAFYVHGAPHNVVAIGHLCPYTCSHRGKTSNVCAMQLVII